MWQDKYQVKWCFNNKTFLYKNRYKKYKNIITDRDKMENLIKYDIPVQYKKRIFFKKNLK